jgi:hypothetical protein
MPNQVEAVFLRGKASKPPNCNRFHNLHAMHNLCGALHKQLPVLPSHRAQLMQRPLELTTRSDAFTLYRCECRKRRGHYRW